MNYTDTLHEVATVLRADGIEAHIVDDSYSGHYVEVQGTLHKGVLFPFGPDVAVVTETKRTGTRTFRTFTEDELRRPVFTEHVSNIVG